MPRFAILDHDYPTPHWDIFLETGSALRTWRLLTPLTPDVPSSAEPIGDHRIVYLDYEGPVSGGRGSVSSIDRGAFDWVIDTAESIVVHLQGTRYRGELRLKTADGVWTAEFISQPLAEPDREQSQPTAR